MAYVRKKYKFTDAGDKAMREFIAKMGSKQAARTKAMKVMKTALKKPAAAKPKAKAKAKAKAKGKAAAKKPRKSPKAETVAREAPENLKDLKAFIVNLERRADRWERVSKMLNKQVPWLSIERFLASDGTKNPIPEADVAITWSTSRNSYFADYYVWVEVEKDAGKVWKWAADTEAEGDGYKFSEDAEEEWSYIHHAPSFDQSPERTATVEDKATGQSRKVTLKFAKEYMDPGVVQKMSGGERGCAHSHLRLWRLAAERPENTLVLEDDVHLEFDRNGDLGSMNGKVWTDRLSEAVKHLPHDFDVLYLGWSGWRGGNLKIAKEDPELSEESRKYIQRAEYVWTTVAYVISQAGAKKLLEASKEKVDQPVDNFMAWEASQGRLKSYVILDEGDEDGTWAGGTVDQFDFQGDSDIQKSDGGHQGDDAKEFAVSA